MRSRDVHLDKKVGQPRPILEQEDRAVPTLHLSAGEKRNEELLNTHKLKLMFLQATWIRNSKYSCAITIMFTKLFAVK